MNNEHNHRIEERYQNLM